MASDLESVMTSEMATMVSLPDTPKQTSPSSSSEACDEVCSPYSPAPISQARSPGAGLIQSHEIATALPKEGILIGDFMRNFAGKVSDIEGLQMDKKEFIKLVKENSTYGADKLLHPKAHPTGDCAPEEQDKNQSGDESAAKGHKPKISKLWGE